MLTEFGFNGGLNTQAIIKAQELKSTKHKTKRNLAPYELFIQKLKRKERNTKLRLINKKAYEIFKKQRKEMLRQLDMKNPEYKVFNKWRLKAYADQELTRSFNGLTCGKAWHLLRKCWEGFVINAREGNIEGMQHYAAGINKYLWMLEEPVIEFELLKER